MASRSTVRNIIAVMTHLGLWLPDLSELDRLAIAFAVRRKGKLTRFDSLDAAASPSNILLLCRGFVIVALFEAIRSYGPSARETLRKLSQPPTIRTEDNLPPSKEDYC
jgi:hypothetical protein